MPTFDKMLAISSIKPRVTGFYHWSIYTLNKGFIVDAIPDEVMEN